MRKSDMDSAARWGAGLALVMVLTMTTYGQSESSHSMRLTGPQAEIFKEVSEELICQCGCNLVLGQCGHINCPSAVPMRNRIEEMVLAGKTKQEMLNWFMTEYRFEGRAPVGKAILSQPETKGFDLMAWMMPFVLFGAFAVVTVYVVIKYSRRRPEVAASPTTTEGDAYQRRIEDEIGKSE